jgi:hypothetical protein
MRLWARTWRTSRRRSWRHDVLSCCRAILPDCKSRWHFLFLV